MSGRRKKRALTGILMGLVGLLCALLLGALFYGMMVYQLAGIDGGAEDGALLAEGTPAPLEEGLPVQALFPGVLLALDPSMAQQTGITAQDVTVSGQVCRVITISYALEGGGTARAISATPEAYLGRLSDSGVQMQLMTGFVLAGLDALYAVQDGARMLAVRYGGCVYVLEAEADEQTLYELGAASALVRKE